MVRSSRPTYRAVDGRPNTRGGEYHINMLPTTCHVYFGSVTGATADGRRAGQPLSEGISPVQGADRRGPDRRDPLGGQDGPCPHRRHAAQPEVHAAAAETDEAGLTTWCTWCAPTSSWTGTTSSSTWSTPRRCARPSCTPKHRDLIVRVAGYSDYFCDLGEALQDEIIARTVLQ
jgi:trans-4-hydroxy-L-proline dehydratase